ncbi:MAG: hypothetical protein B6244_01090 [Candidatus Cloacimonetes bacterium 4572_55]|nr:MAG: hypothetical protein B6244_01090 [Candidatus Cloacimonetes bacterium 4572_55]
MPVESEIIQTYFDRTAKDYDAIYSDEITKIKRLFNRLVHREVYQCFAFAFEQLDSFKGKRMLDVGCGSGRYAMEAAKRGAAHVFGVDLSRGMLEIAERVTKENGVADRCKFVQGDFLQYNVQGIYDYAFALGMLDYTENPTAILRRIFRLTTDRAIFSFPGESRGRAFMEKLKIFRGTCPIHTYSEESIRDLMGVAGFEIIELVKKGRLFLVAARPFVRFKGVYR